VSFQGIFDEVVRGRFTSSGTSYGSSGEVVRGRRGRIVPDRDSGRRSEVVILHKPEFQDAAMWYRAKALMEKLAPFERLERRSPAHATFVAAADGAYSCW
jgi:hypothetical protein